MTRRTNPAGGCELVEREGAWVLLAHGCELGKYSTRRAGLRRAAVLAFARVAPRRWTASAEHAALGCHEEPVYAHTERGALRAARRALAGRWSLAGWTWRVRDDAGRLVASRRGDSVRGWARPVGGAS